MQQAVCVSLVAYEVIGHTRLTNSYILKGENQPECQREQLLPSLPKPGWLD